MKQSILRLDYSTLPHIHQLALHVVKEGARSGVGLQRHIRVASDIQKEWQLKINQLVELMKVRRVFTVRASSSANVDGPTFKPETELGLL